MNSTNQIYSQYTYKRLIITTVLAVLSIFVYANGEPNEYTVAAEDSVKTLGRKKASLQIDTTRSADSLIINDSTTALIADTIQKVDSMKVDDSEIKDIITYRAQDSIVYEVDTKQMYLYDSSYVKYQQIELNAAVIQFDWNTFVLTAEGKPDSSGQLQGKPIFTDAGKTYNATKMQYGFKSKKGKVWEVVTHEGDAYIHSEQVKKSENDEWFGLNSKYTSCDLDHPHYYFKARRIKLVPNKVIVTGPANLWIADVPTPLVLPFGLFPAKQGHKSGIIPPKIGDATGGGALSSAAASSGSTFTLRDMGYFWAVNDNLTLRATFDIFSTGSFGVNLGTQYAKLYKTAGTVAFSYFRETPLDPDLPGVKPRNNFGVSWQHRQDPKASPNNTFTAGVDVRTSTYYQASRVADSRILTSTLSSNINYQHTFAGTPVFVSVGASHNQQISTRQITFTLPVIGLYVTQFSPFRSKVASQKPKWYENLSFNYSAETKAQLTTYDSVLFKPESIDRIQTGIQQQFSTNMPLKIFKYFNLTPAFNYTEWWYFKRKDYRWDPSTIYTYDTAGVPIDSIVGSVKADTTEGFYATRSFNASIALTTKVMGIFKFKNKWIKGLKHVITPALSFNYQPDFSKSIWKTYQEVQNSETGSKVYLNKYDQMAIYGAPGSGTVAALTLSIVQNLEMKIFSKKDTVNHEKKVSILEQIGISGGYNFAAKENKVSIITITASSTRIFDLLRLNMRVNLDPYAVDSVNRRTNTFEWTKNKKLLRFSTASIGASLVLQSKRRVEATPAANAPPPPRFMSDYVSYDPDFNYDFSIPWSFNIDYNFNVTQGTSLNPDTTLFTQTIGLNGDFNITPKWKVNLQTGFDITRKQVTFTRASVTRDLHCWNLSFNWVAYPVEYQQFTIELRINSATLKDLKVTKRGPKIGTL